MSGATGSQVKAGVGRRYSSGGITPRLRSVAKSVKANHDEIALQVARSKNAPEFIVADALNDKVNGIAAKASDRTELGNAILKFGDLAEQQAVRIKNA